VNDGDLVVIVRGDAARYHRPLAAHAGRRVAWLNLDPTESRPEPHSTFWPTFCGEQGDVFVLSPLLNRRDPCGTCQA